MPWSSYLGTYDIPTPKKAGLHSTSVSSLYYWCIEDNPNRCSPSGHRSSTTPSTNTTRSNLCSENHRDSGAKSMYTDGSKTDEGTGSAYCILENYGIITSWKGYLVNECADQLAKEAITKGDPFFLPKSLSYLKSEIRSAALRICQDNWDKGETGHSTHDIVPRVSNKPVGWNREEIMFVTGRGPFPSIFEHMTTARAERKEIQCTMPQNVGLPSPGISKLLQCHLSYSG
ncbi:hypothetical protein AVEN_199682-1 [Araneus ventricosus]|uniref:RNase H type-1 domain-containing protein n=1 Tax=Araneus ventricosus TaxID=182803 RepID=A0A4Y2DHV5_ARAVE|nr:hypothetical protein AVEN_199682-1 [Araneus ventricosus]